MELRGFMHEMILTELEDAVGVENVSHSSDQKLAYGTDYFWLARMTVDKGGDPALPDYVVRPGLRRRSLKGTQDSELLQAPRPDMGWRKRFAGRRSAHGRRHSP